MDCAKHRFLVDALNPKKDYLKLPTEAKMVLVTEPIERRYYVSQSVKSTHCMSRCCCVRCACAAYQHAL
jgi:hypothetical protein